MWSKLVFACVRLISVITRIEKRSLGTNTLLFDSRTNPDGRSGRLGPVADVIPANIRPHFGANRLKLSLRIVTNKLRTSGRGHLVKAIFLLQILTKPETFASDPIQCV